MNLNQDNPEPTKSQEDLLLKREEKRAETIQQLKNPRRSLSRFSDDRLRLARRLWLWRLGAHSGGLIAISEDEIKLASPAELIDLASIFSETGTHQRALELIDRAIEKEPTILDQRRYIGLISATSPFRPNLAERYKNELAAAEQYRADRGKFKELIGNEKTSICLVGNSPCELGKSNGETIDNHDIVIRFNDFSSSPKFAKDYGRKTDIWAHAFRFENIWRRDEESFSHTLIPGPPIYWRNPLGPSFLIDYAMAQTSAEETPSRIYFDLLTKIGFPPSNGLLVLFWAIQLRGGTNNISTFGFSMTEQVNSGPVHYFDNGIVRRKKPHHDWQREWKVFQSLLTS